MLLLKQRWERHIFDQGFQMLNDEKIAKKSFKAIDDFIELM
jgi:hypothetical protein